MTDKKAAASGPELLGRLSISQVLSEYESPILFVADDPKATSADWRHWLFNWRAGGRRGSPRTVPEALAGLETWLAFPISERRLAQLTEEHVSLREAILLAEDDLLVLSGQDPLHPLSIEVLRALELAPALLPRAEISVYGNTIVVPGSAHPPAGLRLVIHMVPGAAAAEHPDLALSSAVEASIQRYLSWAARDVLAAGTDSVDQRPIAIPAEDWAGMTTLAASPGTLTVLLEAPRANVAQRRALEAALRALREIVAGSSPGSSGGQIGGEGVASLVSLMDILQTLDLSMSLRWDEDGEEQYAMVGVPGATRALRRLSQAGQGDPVGAQDLPAAVRVKLSPTEASELRKEVDPNGGGHESLIFALQHQFVEENVLLVRPEQVERIVRYVQDYGEGGFQNRLKPIYRALHPIGISFAGIR